MTPALQAIVLAGGLGTRLRDVLGSTPKVIAPIEGRPWLVWLLEALAVAGFAHVCLAVGHRREAVKRAIEASKGDFGSMEVRYSEETEPLGTGGALRHAAGTLPLVPTFALNGDTWVDVPWVKMLAEHVDLGSDLSIAIRAVQDRSRYGAIELREHTVIGFGEKERRGSGYINAGVYLFNPALLLGPDVPERFSFEIDFIPKRLTSIRVTGFVVEGPFLDIGIPTDLERAAGFLRDRTRRHSADLFEGSSR
jgi:D-glycero-alpha-D-manno-heptose 1-phosphate guanylyltransferase